MEHWLEQVIDIAVAVAGRLVFALGVYVIGRIVIRSALKWMKRSRLLQHVDGAVQTFLLSFSKIALFTILGIMVIGILGVPMSSVIAVLASAGVAIGLALQGALSNLAGGILLLVNKPFRLGDYVEAAGVSGTVKEVSLFYTVFITPDNKRITVPNGTMMNANIIDYSSEPLRRVDLVFTCSKQEDPQRIEAILTRVMQTDERIATEPKPFARIQGHTNEAAEYAVKVWCKNEDYWDVYYDLTEAVMKAFRLEKVALPALNVGMSQKMKETEKDA